jgi:hypothetical protein
MIRYISTEEGKAIATKRDGEILIQRKKGNLTVPYRITDDPLRLTKQDWYKNIRVNIEMKYLSIGKNVLLLYLHKDLLGSLKVGHVEEEIQLRFFNKVNRNI